MAKSHIFRQTMDMVRRVAGAWSIVLFFGCYTVILVLAGYKGVSYILRGIVPGFHVYSGLSWRPCVSLVLGNPIPFLKDDWTDWTQWTWWDEAAFLLAIPLVFLCLGAVCRALCRRMKLPSRSMAVAGATWLAMPYLGGTYGTLNSFEYSCLVGALGAVGACIGYMIGSWKHGLNVFAFIVLLITFASVMVPVGGAVVFFSTEVGPYMGF